MANTEKSSNLEEKKVAVNAKNDKLGAKHDENEAEQKGLKKFYTENGMVINIILIAILVIAIAVFAIYKFVITPKNEKASAAMQATIETVCQRGMLTSDTLALKAALEGNDDIDGFEAIADGSSAAAKYSAKHYAALCYLRMGQKDEALDMLLQCKKKDDLLWYEAQMLIGDLYDEKGETDNAATYYEKAAKGESSFIAPIALWKLGMLCERNNDWESAYKNYKQIEDKYYERYAEMGVDKYLERAKAKANK